MRISDWSSDVCSSDLVRPARPPRQPIARGCDGGGRSRRLRGRPGATAVRRTEEAPVAGPAVAVTGTAVAARRTLRQPDRKSVLEGKSVSVRVNLGGLRIFTKKNNN